MNSLEYKRHTLAHLLAAAIMNLYPDAKRTIGPAIDDGFYFDFEFPTKKPSEKDFPAIEKEMRRLLPTWTSFSKHDLDAAAAKKEYPENPYKHELIDEFTKDAPTVSFYKSGEYWDLCRGGHLENPAEEITADSFMLDRIAGAYWRGDEKNTMLTRIYGLAFDTKDELDAHLARREEARQRDHRKIGKELDLFTFSELVGPGLPLWTPKGTLVRNLLDQFISDLRSEYGYQKVTIPHFTKRNLYETSGHWEKFSDELFRVTTREGKEYAVKPMNCPHHTQIFDRKQHSYRDMPQRFSETTMVYRDEQSGELGGLTRVLSITQDDSHIFCRHTQVKEEFFNIWDIVDRFYGAFGFSLKVRLSFHDPKEPEKYLGTPEVWENAENALRDIAKERNADYFEAEGEAAMYGPKLDFMATDSMGRQHQVATIQLDMNLPERFDLTCVNEKGERERIVMIHCAIMGSIERFSAVLLEHLNGMLPLWLAPVQLSVLPVSEKHLSYATEVYESLKAAGIRAELDASDESLGKKIRAAKGEKVPYFLVIGDKEVEGGTVTVESRDRGNEGMLSVEALLEKLSQEIAAKQ